MQINNVQLQDSAWQDPFNENPQLDRNYLTYFKDEKHEYNFSTSFPGIVLAYEFTLHDIKTFRSRTVYSLITLISEVSGFADILFIVAGIFLKSFYTPRKLEASLLKHVGPVELPKPVKRRKRAQRQLPFKLSSEDVADILKTFTSYCRLKINIWFILL